MKRAVWLLLLLLAVPLAAAYGVTFYNPAWNPQDGKVFETVEAGMPYTLDVKVENIAITKIVFTINRTVNNGGITVYHLLSPPKAVPEVPENDSYEFNELKYAGFVPFDTTNLIYQFKVSKGWLENNSVSRDSIVLHAYNRFTDAWDELPTKMTGDDDSFVRYRADGKGVHYLLIGKSQSGAKAESVIAPEKPEYSQAAANEVKEELSEVEKVKPSQQPSPQPVVQPAAPAPQPVAQPGQPAVTSGSTALGGIFIIAIIVVIVILYFIFGRQGSAASVDKELHNYIDESLKRGKTKDEVKHRLLEVGWHHERVEKALSKHQEHKHQHTHKAG